MRLFNQKIWSGTACFTNVYTDAEFNTLLGSADYWAIHAHVTRATGTSTALKILIEHSADNKSWISLTSYTTSSYTAQSVADTLVVAEAPTSTNARLAFVRIGIATSLAAQEADVELYVTGRGI